jgi:hypothetical protein
VFDEVPEFNLIRKVCHQWITTAICKQMIIFIMVIVLNLGMKYEHKEKDALYENLEWINK